MTDPRLDALNELVVKWKEPEFWRQTGNLMDSIDCADELEAALASLPEPAQTKDETS